MGSYKILDLSSAKKWNELLKQLPIDQQDIYFTPEYYELYENKGDGKAKCFVFEQNGFIAIYPFLINSVNKLGYDLDKEYCDIQGAYGYNGIVSSSYQKETEKNFTTVFNQYCLDNNIVSEFTRFHPIIKNHQFSCHLEPLFNQNNVIVDLEITDFFKFSYEHSTRKNINKAQRNGLRCMVLEGEAVSQKYIDIFINIYFDTMRRNNAESYYYFSKIFINQLFISLAKKSRLYFTLSNEEFISAELVLLGTEFAYSFLGGTNARYFEYRPNDCLKNFIIHDLKNLGLKSFCLGGGNEGVFRYKKTYAINGVYPFFIGVKNHNSKVYSEIIIQWERKYPKLIDKYKNIFLRYRNTI